MVGRAQADTPAGSGRSRVAMLVSNDISRDNRVKREALALADAGWQVTLVGFAGPGLPSREALGPVDVVRVEVNPAIRTALAKRRTRRRRKVPRLAPRTEAETQALRLVWTARIQHHALHARNARSLGVGPGTTAAWLRHVLGLRVAKARRSGVVRRAAAQRRAYLWLSAGWQAADRLRSRSRFSARWHRLLPEILDLERAFLPVLDAIRPDVVHAHDVHTVSTAATAVARARKAGRDARWVYDAHEYVSGEPVYGRYTPRLLAAYADLEREFVRDAEAVVTVSPAIARVLHKQYRLRREPVVVLNAPPSTAAPIGSRPTVRDAAALGADQPLLVYSGNLTPVRGLDAMVEALGQLSGVHLALVVPHKITDYVQGLIDRAAELGAADRLHVLPPVPGDELPAYLSGATLAVHGLSRCPSHDMALPNKLFEYLHARLPLVVSDVPAMAGFVRDRGIGEVYAADDAADLAAAVRRALGRLADYRSAYARQPELFTEFVWERQADVLRDLYAELFGAPVPALEDTAPTRSTVGPAAAARRPAQPCLGIGPANMAGQAWEWARAVERHLTPSVRAEVLAVDYGLAFSSDVRVSQETFARDSSWQRDWERHVVDTWTHVLMEAGRPVLGTQHGSDFAGDAEVLARHGIVVGLVFHGSEIRSPRRHRRLYADSPFAHEDDYFALLQRKVDALRPLVDTFDGPKFVTTPDLHDEVPEAVWLPVVVDHDAWKPGPPPLERKVPVVVHAPSNPALKGTALIEPAMEDLAARGWVEFRSLRGIPPAEMPRVVNDADIVLDHFVIGNYSVMSVQAMAAERLTVCNVADRVLARLPDEPPLLRCAPADLRAALERVLDDRDAARALALRGRDYTTTYHDGTVASRVLAAGLGLA